MINDNDIITLAEQTFEAESGEDAAMLIEIARLTLAEEEYQQFLAHLSHLRDQEPLAEPEAPAYLRLSTPLPCARTIEGQPCGQPAEVAVLSEMAFNFELLAPPSALEPTWSIAPVCPACIEEIEEVPALADLPAGDAFSPADYRLTPDPTGDVQHLLHLLTLNDYTLTRQLAGVTAEEALRPLPFRGNSLHWVVGHIVEARNYMLDLLGEERVWSEEECRPYASGSRPITGPEDEHHPWAAILQAADESLARIRSRLEDITPEELAASDGPETLGGQLMRMLWHEAYHTGQTEILRQLAGKDDQVL